MSSRVRRWLSARWARCRWISWILRSSTGLARSGRHPTTWRTYILDTFLVEVAAPADEEKKGGRLKRLQKKMAKLFQNSTARHTIASAIEDMKKRLQEVADRRDRFSVPVALPAPPTKVDPRLAYMHNEAAQLIGIDKAKAKLIAMLWLPSQAGNGDADDVCAGSSNMMRIVCVVVVGGLGKTTLAKAVYDELKPRYNCGAFVSFGREPDLVHVFTDIFFHLDKNKYKDIREVRSLQLLIWELRKLLENKRYFIVIDDVWDLTSLETIRSSLDQKHSGSRVITTTRSREVACEEVYELDPLSCDNSKKLFYMRLFGGGKCPDNQLDGVADKILDKCGGVPLAIITMASLLVGKSREAWLEVCSSPGFYHSKDNKQMDDTMWILSLSYYDLPSDLKNCLLYLSVYPEDYFIMKNSLIWKWVAEGLIEKKSGTSLFQQGEEYFHHLINRNMIQAVDTNEDGIDEKGLICGCRVHDMVLDLIRDFSGGENFVTISNGDKGTLLQNKVRRLAHQNRRLNQMHRDNHMNMTQVRSLVVCQCDIDIDSRVLHPTRFKLLRVLVLERCKVSKSDQYGLEHLGNLLHLRYLGLRHTWSAKLPEEIGALKLLQTLDLEGTYTVGELPSSISLLPQLVCLRGYGSMRVPNGFLRKMTSLEELHLCPDGSMYSESTLQFMKELGNLRELTHSAAAAASSAPAAAASPRARHRTTPRATAAPPRARRRTLPAAPPPAPAAAPPRAPPHRSATAASLCSRRLPAPAPPAPPPHDPVRRRTLPAAARPRPASPRPAGGASPCRRRLAPGRARLTPLAHAPPPPPHPRPAAASSAVPGRLLSRAEAATARAARLVDWMVQFELDEDSNSTSVSFSIWNGRGDVPFGSKAKDEGCRVAPAIGIMMPNLQELQFYVPLWELYEHGNGSCGNLGWECLPSLSKVGVLVSCSFGYDDDVEKAEAELRHQAEIHPNRPALEIEHLWIITAIPNVILGLKSHRHDA
ncbi:unnamed protein product [Urochloa decumbens]|uniref:NB-ARC domain-containing protein n=1 Tax=Urochloa decumbens TaxID=240449 RepID=A0ABC9AZN7_9POAL